MAGATYLGFDSINRNEFILHRKTSKILILSLVFVDVRSI